MHDYIPRQGQEFKMWLENFVHYAQAHAGELGLSPSEVAELVQVQTTYSAAFTRYVELENLAEGAYEAKKQARKAAEEVFRSRSQMLQAMHGITDAQLLSLGLRVRDKEPTPLSPDLVLKAGTPLVLLDWSLRQQVTVHFGPNPGNERENGLPEGVAGVKLYVRIGNGEEQWLGDETRSPYVHQVETGVPVIATYRAAYFDRRFRVGPPGQPSSCTVTV